jgi:hypothetical protein
VQIDPEGVGIDLQGVQIDPEGVGIDLQGVQIDPEGGRISVFRTVVELRNGTLMMLLRSTDNFIFASYSHDQVIRV